VLEKADFFIKPPSFLIFVFWFFSEKLENLQSMILNRSIVISVNSSKPLNSYSVNDFSYLFAV